MVKKKKEFCLVALYNCHLLSWTRLLTSIKKSKTRRIELLMSFLFLTRGKGCWDCTRDNDWERKTELGVERLQREVGDITGSKLSFYHNSLLIFSHIRVSLEAYAHPTTPLTCKSVEYTHKDSALVHCLHFGSSCLPFQGMWFSTISVQKGQTSSSVRLAHILKTHS